MKKMQVTKPNPPIWYLHTYPTNWHHLGHVVPHQTNAPGPVAARSRNEGSAKIRLNLQEAFFRRQPPGKKHEKSPMKYRAFSYKVAPLRPVRNGINYKS